MSAIAHIVLPVVAALVINGVVYAKGWNTKQNPSDLKNRFLPPGWVIAVVWILLFALMGYSHYLVYSDHCSLQNNGYGKTIVSIGIVGMMIYCLAYPFLTGLQQNSTYTKVLNLSTLVSAGKIAIITAYYCPVAAPYLYPLFIWASWVNFAQLME
jgi:tryptophan-rich sensory protein